MDNQRNLLFAVVLCGVLLFGWDFVVGRMYPQPDPVVAAASPSASAPRTREGGLTNPADVAEEKRDLATELAAPTRIPVAGRDIEGSINLVGARLDDVSLKNHRQTVEKDSGPVRLFSPAGTPAQQFAQFGWAGEGVKLPDARTVWTAQGEKLTPQTPVTLIWDNGEGQRFSIRFTIDDQYMVTAEQTVANTATGPVVIRPFSFINRTSATASVDSWNVHSGPIGSFDNAVDYDWDYDDVAEEGSVAMKGRPDWVGFNDIYWLSALAPQKGTRPEASFRSVGGDKYRADLIYEPQTVAPGRQVSRSTQLFVGAKESDVLSTYEEAGLNHFNRAIDWGWFEIIEKPILWLLKHLFALVGNFGVAIMLLTVVIRGLLFPIAQKQFASMAGMRAVQPKMKALQERYKDDRVQLQQEMAKLYKSEGVNPLAGCLPLLLQIPIFFALYKVLLISIEMRHQPFALWIKDLSVPDPAHFVNLFGLLPFDPPSFLAIGPLALILGITMYLQFKLNPAQMDPVQQQMFMFMPWIMMFVMAPFAAGLLLYWCTSNVLTIAQQWYLYSKHPQLKQQAEQEKTEKGRAKARDSK